MSEIKRGRKKKVVQIRERPVSNNKLHVEEHSTVYMSSTIDFGGIKVFVPKEEKKEEAKVQQKVYSYPRWESGTCQTLKISKEFLDLPETTESCCWWCTEQFLHRPLSLPIHQHKITKKFILNGIFCSWNCTKAFSFAQKDSNAGRRNDYMNSIVREIYGKFIHIIPAPSRFRLNKFGGDLTLEEFRTKGLIRNVDTTMKVTPITLAAMKFTF